MKKYENERFVILGGRFLYLYNGDTLDVDVPDGVETICASAFARLRYLEKINLRDDMEIDEDAFKNSAYEEKFREFLTKKGS